MRDMRDCRDRENPPCAITGRGYFNFINLLIIVAAVGARPAVVGNSFSATTGDSEPSESAIWVVGSDGQVTVRWVNADGCKSPG